MTPSLRTARACQTAALFSTSIAIYSATISLWYAIPGLYVATLAWWCGNRAHADHRRILARHAQERRPVAGPAELPVPCCQFWTHSNGVVHGADCTRPPLARRDGYRLSAADQAVFQQLAARIDLPGPNDRSSAA
jgi:hypothetical protein